MTSTAQDRLEASTADPEPLDDSHRWRRTESRSPIGCAQLESARPTHRAERRRGESGPGRQTGGLEEEADTTVVMLAGGVVDGVFVAHADLEGLQRLSRGERASGSPNSWGRALDLLENKPQPTIAAIDGQAWGGGCEIALACTLRVGSERATWPSPR